MYFQILSGYLHAVIYSPWLLFRFAFDMTLNLLPWARPTREWSFDQAGRVRVVKLLLLYWSLTRSGDRLTLRPGREKNRFEVFRPRSPKLYKGVLSDALITPAALGATWTPARPPPATLIKPDLTVALHFHGGAFVIGNGRDEDTGFLARTLIQYMGCAYVCTPQYRLASGKDGRFPAPVQDALTAYLYLLQEKKIPPGQIILSGDSAGANIALGLLRYIHEHGKEDDIQAPGAVALWSPWVDVNAALAQDMTKSPGYCTDYLVREFGRWGARSISGNGIIEPSSRYLSPLHHPFQRDANIPVFVHAGDREVLCDDIKAFYENYQKQGWKLHLALAKNCPHDILLIGHRIGFAENAKLAARDAGRFFSKNTDMGLRCAH